MAKIIDLSMEKVYLLHVVICLLHGEWYREDAEFGLIRFQDDNKPLVLSESKNSEQENLKNTKRDGQHDEMAVLDLSGAIARSGGARQWQGCGIFCVKEEVVPGGGHAWCAMCGVWIGDLATARARWRDFTLRQD
uniref:Uncharacterized protein n=1 Tax=Oryza barthii TaxID=65489 RepID=A0A0D3H1K3_9ORYZ